LVCGGVLAVGGLLITIVMVCSGGRSSLVWLSATTILVCGAVFVASVFGMMKVSEW
jgi:hypothetical protein